MITTLPQPEQNPLQEFENEEFGKLHIRMINNKPHFPATECAKILGYANPYDAVIRHCQHAIKYDVPYPKSKWRYIEMNYIPEGDLYRLIIRSKLPAAERFEAWVFDEVLSVNQNRIKKLEKALAHAEYFRSLCMELLKKQQQENKNLVDYISKLEKRAEYCDVILQCEDVVSVTLIAQDYGLSDCSFNKLLHSLHIQYKLGETWLLYPEYAGKDYVRTLTYQISEQRVMQQVYWKPHGRLFLYLFLRTYGILPLMERDHAINK